MLGSAGGGTTVCLCNGGKIPFYKNAKFSLLCFCGSAGEFLFNRLEVEVSQYSEQHGVVQVSITQVRTKISG